MSAKLKTSGVFLALALGSVLAIHQAGCLSPQQQLDVQAYNQQLDKDQGVVLDVQLELAKYADQLKAVLADVKAGKLPAASGLELGQKIMANMDTARAKLTDIMFAIANTKTAVQKLKDSGTPWWAYAVPAGLTVAQLLGTFVPQLSFLVPIAGALKGKLEVTQEIAGSLSRTVDQLAPKPEACAGADSALADRKQDLLREEQSEDLVAVKADYDELRKLAAAGQI